MKVFIACGGTGGHFYPGLTIAQRLQAENHQVTILLSGKDTEKFAEVAQSKGIQSRIQVKYSRATSLLKKPLLILKVIQNFMATWRLLRQEKPQVVLGMGGFANFSIYSARFCRKHTKLYVHEGNAVVGNANKWLSSVASKLLLSLEPINKNQIKCTSVITGFPIRQELINQAQTDSNKIQKKPMILITGGSQGAKSMNTKLANALITYPKLDQLVINHVAGNAEEQIRLEQIYQQHKAVTIHSFLNDIGSFYQNCNLAIVRSGASTLFELALFKVPAIAIPLPWAADQHQFHNAEAVNKLTSDGTVQILEQNNFDPMALHAHLDTLLDSPNVFEKRGLDMHRVLGAENATKSILSEITS